MADIFIDANQVAHDSFLTAGKAMFEDAFIPNVIYKLVRGGDNFGNAASEILKYGGIKNKLSEVTVGHYTHTNTEEDSVGIYNYGLPPWLIRKGSKILLTDDLPDSGDTAGAVEADLKDLRNWIGLENLKLAVLVYKNLVNEPIKESIKYRRFYNNNLFTKLHDFQLKNHPGKIIELKNPYTGPDYYHQEIIVDNKHDPKYWVDFGTHELVGMTPQQIKDRYGEDVWQALSKPDLEKISEGYGPDFAVTLEYNLDARKQLKDEKIKLINVPGTKPVTLLEVLGITH